LKSDFKDISQKWSPYWDDVSRALFWSLPWMSRSQHDLAAKSCPANNFVICSLISKNISQKWSPYWYDVSRATFETLPWRSRSQHYLAAKSCRAHNFVIWSRILKIFHRNDHHIKKRWRAQHLGRYLESQGHSMTLQQNRVRPITWLFEVRFRNYFTVMTTMFGRCVTRNI